MSKREGELGQRVSELERAIEQIWEDTSVCLGLLDKRRRLYRREKKAATGRKKTKKSAAN